MHVCSTPRRLRSFKGKRPQAIAAVSTVLDRIAQLAIGVAIATLCPALLASLPADAQTQPSASATSEQAYGVLKAGDQVQVTVVGFPELSGQQPLSADGTLQLPLVGSLAVVGLTPQQAVESLTAALLPYVRRPQVSLVVTDSRPLRISVTGEVSKPGPYRVNTEDLSGDPYPTLSSILALAGGITPNADLRSIVIRRASAASPTATAPLRASGTEPPEIRINLWEAIQQGRLASDPLIMDGDEIIVSRATTVSPEQQQQFLRSTVAPTDLAISVAGEVRQPGRIAVDPSGGVSAAVAAAGGPTTEANLGEIVLFRMGPNGQLTQQTYQFGADSGPLHQGDVILVGRNTVGSVSNVFNFLGTLLNPFSALSNIFDSD